jgi:hypothetical protein
VLTVPDEIIDTTQDESGGSSATSVAPATADPSSAASTAIPSPGDSLASDTTQPLETKDDQVIVDPIDAALKDLPTVEQLKAEAERGVQYARALQDLRPIAEQAKLQSEKFKPWSPIVDRFNDPTKLESQLELASQFLKDQVIEGGRSIPDTKGAVEWLDKNSPARADSLMVDLLQSKVAYNDVEDTRLNHVFRQVVGKSVDEVRAALQDLETRPVSQVIDKAELEAIDPKFHTVYKALPPETKEWLMDERTSETARNDYLQRALSDEQRTVSDREANERATTERQTRETTFFNEAKAEGEKAVDEGLGQLLNTILDSTFKDISNDTVTLTGSKDTDVRLRGVVGAVMVTLTDPVKRPYVESMLGLKFDPEIDKYSAMYENATIQAKIQARYGDKGMTDKYQMDADNAAMWIRAKGNDLAGQITDFFSAILGVSNGNRASLLANANGGRQHIQGTPSNQAGVTGQPQFQRPLGPERTAEIVERFAR